MAKFKVRGALTVDESEFVPRGFTGLRLLVGRFEQLTDEQIFLLEQEEVAGREELDRLVERLRIRLGEEGCVAVRGVECYVPGEERHVGTEARRHEGKRQNQYQAFLPSPLRASVPSCLRAFSSIRPLHLLQMPCEIPVMVRPSHDRDGAPVSFGFEGEAHRIIHAVGPERISGMWWMGNDKTRDYFDVEDEEGKRWWLFRVVQTFKWYLHGRFE